MVSALSAVWNIVIYLFDQRAKEIQLSNVSLLKVYFFILVEGRQLALDIRHTQLISIIFYISTFDFIISIILQAAFGVPEPECRLGALIKSGNVMLAPPFVLFGVAIGFYGMALYNAPFSRMKAQDPATHTKHQNGFLVNILFKNEKKACKMLRFETKTSLKKLII